VSAGRGVARQAREEVLAGGPGSSHPASRWSGVSFTGGGQEEVGGVTKRAGGRDGGGGPAGSWGWGDSDITRESVLKQQPVAPGKRGTVRVRW
jgi:hypothetical protein